MSTSIKPFTSSFCFLVCVGSRCESFFETRRWSAAKVIHVSSLDAAAAEANPSILPKEKNNKGLRSINKTDGSEMDKRTKFFFRWVVSTDHHSCLITFVSWSIQPLIVVEYSPNVQMQKLGEDLAGNYTHWVRSSGWQSLLMTERSWAQFPATSELFGSTICWEKLCRKK